MKEKFDMTSLESSIMYQVYFSCQLPENFDRKFFYSGEILRVKCINGVIVYCQNLKTKKVYKDSIFIGGSVSA